MVLDFYFKDDRQTHLLFWGATALIKISKPAVNETKKQGFTASKQNTYVTNKYMCIFVCKYICLQFGNEKDAHHISI